MLLPFQIERILALGGGLSLDASDYSPSQLERIAAFGRGKIIFKLDKDNSL